MQISIILQPRHNGASLATNKYVKDTITVLYEEESANKIGTQTVEHVIVINIEFSLLIEATDTVYIMRMTS